MEAADGLEALDVLEKYHFNLVITDLVMPNLNGFHLVARIRGKWPDTPLEGFWNLIVVPLIGRSADDPTDGLRASVWYRWPRA